MRYFSIIFIVICLLFSMLLLNSCKETGLEEPLDAKVSQDEISKQDTETDENIRTENNESIDKDTQDDSIQETSDRPENNIMFYNSEVNFAFIYPQEYLTISSYPGWPRDYGDLSLNVSINSIENLEGSIKEDAISERDALKAGGFGPDTSFSFEPSRKVIKIGDTFVKEFLVFARYDDVCDIAFDWETHFYNNDYQIQIILSADKERITESMDQYFIYDEAGCPGQKVWDFDKQDEFYDKLTTGQASGPASEWFDASGSIMNLLQVNDFKGASAGYSRLIDKRLFEENIEEKYLIDVSYPQFQSAAAGGLDESINKIIYEQKVLPIIDDFKDEISSYGDEDFVFKYFLGIDYSVVMYDENGISVCLYISPYLGGAHGMLHFETINFDLEKMSLVEMEDLFTAGYDYPGVISEYCRENLTKQINDTGFEPDKQWLENGTDPDYMDNFANFLITPSELIIKFPAYQVAAYAAGDFTVNVPYEEFEGNLNPESIIGDYNK